MVRAVWYLLPKGLRQAEHQDGAVDLPVLLVAQGGRVYWVSGLEMDTWCSELPKTLIFPKIQIFFLPLPI